MRETEYRVEMLYTIKLLLQPSVVSKTNHPHPFKMMLFSS